MANRNVVVIGGSAGAINPLNAILRQLPSDLEAAVLVVVHVPARKRAVCQA